MRNDSSLKRPLRLDCLIRVVESRLQEQSGGQFRTANRPAAATQTGNHPRRDARLIKGPGTTDGSPHMYKIR